MKTKLSNKHFERDLKLLGKFFNEVVFITPIGKEKNFHDVADHLIKDFIEAVQVTEILGKRPAGVGMFVIDFKDNEKPVNIARVYLEMFEAKNFPTGKGFTPKLTASAPSELLGFNCLAKAVAFGSFLTIHDIPTMLVRSVDHAMCLIRHNDDSYLCDPMSGSLWRMHGTFVQHDYYGWYESCSKDDFHYNYLAIQQLDYGGLNAIFQSFQFLSEVGWEGRSASKLVSEECELGLLGFMDPKLGYHKKIRSIDWANLRQKLFGGMEEYRVRYEKEWLLEEERLRQRREGAVLRIKFDDAVFDAVSATGFDVKERGAAEFVRELIPLLRPVKDEVLGFLEKGQRLQVQLSQSTATYLSVFKQIISQDQELQEYSISIMRSKLMEEAC